MLGSWRKALANWSSTTHVRIMRQSLECISDLSPAWGEQQLHPQIDTETHRHEPTRIWTHKNMDTQTDINTHTHTVYKHKPLEYWSIKEEKVRNVPKRLVGWLGDTAVGLLPGEGNAKKKTAHEYKQQYITACYPQSNNVWKHTFPMHHTKHTSLQTTLSVCYTTVCMYTQATVRAEISAVCKFCGFHGHLMMQRKFNPWKFASLQQLEICNST